jgi:hypothetical protein
MTEDELQKLKYPVGKFQRPTEFPESVLAESIKEIALFPARIKSAVANLNDEQLDTRYRPEGWTIRQVVHHVADSHLNAFIRFKLALTEETPTVKPYFEERWAEMPDTKKSEISSSLKIIDGLHSRWTILLKSLSKNDFEKKFFHPEQKREVPLTETLTMYAWHGRHHLAHITSLKERMEWK